MQVKPSGRKPAGIFLILGVILGWSVIVASAAPRWEGAPMPVQALIYLFAGIVWIFPVRPILTWMELGKWRE